MTSDPAVSCSTASAGSVEDRVRHTTHAHLVQNVYSHCIVVVADCTEYNKFIGKLVEERECGGNSELTAAITTFWCAQEDTISSYLVKEYTDVRGGHEGTGPRSPLTVGLKVLAKYSSLRLILCISSYLPLWS